MVTAEIRAEDFTQPHSLLAFRPKEILCVGNDERLLLTRSMILEYSGFRATCVSPSQVQQAFRGRTVALVIVCHTVTDRERESIYPVVPRGIKVVCLEEMTLPAALIGLATQHPTTQRCKVNDKQAQEQAVKELANQAHAEEGSKECEEAKERRAAAEAQLTKDKK
jgi:hypothetical protein